MPFSKKIEDLIADFRGLPRTISRSSLRPPLPLGDILETFKEDYASKKIDLVNELRENWKSVFGKWAGRCHIVQIRDRHILVISVNNPTLRSELGFEKHNILERIRKLEHCQEIDDILIRG